MRLARWAVALGLLASAASVAAPPGTLFAPPAARADGAADERAAARAAAEDLSSTDHAVLAMAAQRLERQDRVRRIYLEQLDERGVVLDPATLEKGVTAARRALLAGTVRWAGAERPAAAGSRQESLQRNLLQGLPATL